MRLEMRNIAVTQGDFTLSASTSIEPGKLTALLGPSGCGKTTLLRAIAGLVPVSGGTIVKNGADITPLPPQKRNIGLVFQDYALFPHMTVENNIRYGMKEKGTRGDHRVRTLLSLVRLSGFEKRNVTSLSGGEQQRIALARALAASPDILLLDEPLSALDALLRKILRKEIREIQEKTGITTIYVTHDQEEAMSISHKIILMNNGRIIQEGTPEELYSMPETVFTAAFIGTGNIITIHGTTGSMIHTDAGLFPWPEELPLPAKESYLFFRPEDCRIFTADTPPPVPGMIGGPCKVGCTEYSGGGYLLETMAGKTVIKLKSNSRYALGESLYWSVPVEKTRILNCPA